MSPDDTLEAARPPIAALVEQHADEAAMLRGSRSMLVRAPHIRLSDLARHDERIAAHLDGLAVAGSAGLQAARAALARPGVGETFVAAVRALEDRDADGLRTVVALAQAVPEALPGLASALGWVSAPLLRGLVPRLLEAGDAFHRRLGLLACSLHGVDPGEALRGALADGDAALRARALRLAGELGRLELLGACLAGLGDADPAARFQAARAALLLGDRDASVQALREMALGGGAWQAAALGLVLKALPPAQSHALLAALAQAKAPPRLLVRGAGLAGDTRFVPWLIEQMDDPRLARLAGEAFGLLTGVELPPAGLEGPPPAGAPEQPSGDPENEDVALDEDGDLPWPDAARVGDWWTRHRDRQPAGERRFVGAAVTAAHCRAVLEGGLQRHRIVAAEHLVLLAPGTPLFNVAAPARRQRRALSGR